MTEQPEPTSPLVAGSEPLDAPFAGSPGPDAPLVSGPGPDAPLVSGPGPDAPLVSGPGPDAPSVSGPGPDAPLYVQLGFTDAEWGLLTGLPHAVITAASNATVDSPRKTRAESAAGVDVISDARASASPLVAAVAAAAVAETGDPELGEEPPVIEPGDPQAYAQDVLERAAEVNTLLAAKSGQADAETYKHWLVEIAESVVGAASSGGVLGIGAETVTDSERAFRDGLAKALTD